MRVGCFVLIIFAAVQLQGQNSVKGRVADSTNAPVPYIAIALLNAADSSIYRGVNNDDNGVFEFTNIKKGNYKVKVACIGYKEFYTSAFSVDSATKLELPEIKLSSAGINLKEVSVSVQKKTIEFKGGNIIVYIDGSPLAIGNSAYDLLSRLPGVMVDNDNISISGNSGVKVMIDDRIQQLSGSQLIALLKSLQGSNIDKIEVLKIPPVKYDAAGGAGLINIKTKRVKITGFSGSVNGNVSQGFYTRFGSGTSLNYKGKKLAIFTGLNANQSPTRYNYTSERNVKHDTVNTHLYQVNANKTVEYIYSYYFGGDWFINKKNILGFKYEGSPGNSDVDRRGQIQLKNNDQGYDLLPYHSFTINKWNSNNANINFEHLLDTVGGKIKFAADYTNNNSSVDGHNENYFKDNNSNDVKPAFIYTNKNTAGISLLASKIDLEKKLSKVFSIETGVKYSYSDLYSDFELQRQNQITNVYETDTMFTNKFVYNEQIQAGYFNLMAEKNKLSYSLGVRAENTIIKAQSVTKGTIYNREYFGLFPLLSIDYNSSANHNFSFSYNRRLERPNYTSFNPYRAFFSNILVSGQGNPYLMPQYNNAFNLSHIYKGTITNAVNYNLIQNALTGYIYQNDSTKETIWKQGNLKYMHTFAYNFSTNIEITKKWRLVFNTSFHLMYYDGTLNNLPYKASGFSYGGWMNNQFSLPKDIKLEVSAFCYGPWLGGVSYTQTRGALHISLKKSFFNNKLDVYLSANDIFYTLNLYNKFKFQNLDFYTKETMDTRRYNFGLSYNFGKIKVQQRKNQSSEDEKRRIGR